MELTQLWVRWEKSGGKVCKYDLLLINLPFDHAFWDMWHSRVTGHDRSFVFRTLVVANNFVIPFMPSTPSVWQIFFSHSVIFMQALTCYRVVLSRFSLTPFYFSNSDHKCGFTVALFVKNNSVIYMVYHRFSVQFLVSRLDKHSV